MLLGLIGTALTLLIIALLIRDVIRLRTLPRLSTPATLPSARVSIVIPARNEASRIGPCLEGVLDQHYGAYEVLVLDDGSTDATPQLLAAAAQRAAAEGHTVLHVLPGAPLPAGWAGKCFACQQAAARATGDWLLFLDADTAPGPHLVAALVAEAEARDLDALSIWPYQELRSFWERVVLPPFVLLIQSVYPLERLNAADARPEEVLANGQCLLIRRSAYEAIGGHGAVRGAVLEDVELAQALRRAGYRVGLADGMAHLQVRMYRNGREIFEGLTKNAVAGLRNGGPRAAWAGMRQFLIVFTPFWLLAAAAWMFSAETTPLIAAHLLIDGIVSAVVAYGYYALLLRRLYHIPVFYSLLWPLGLLIYFALAARAAWLVYRGHGVSWKGRAYVG